MGKDEGFFCQRFCMRDALRAISTAKVPGVTASDSTTGTLETKQNRIPCLSVALVGVACIEVSIVAVERLMLTTPITATCFCRSSGVPPALRYGRRNTKCTLPPVLLAGLIQRKK